MWTRLGPTRSRFTASVIFPLLERIDDDIDDLEDAIVREPGDAELAAVFRLKRLIVGHAALTVPETG